MENSLNRVLIGMLILITVAMSYIFKFDFLLVLLVSILSVIDLIKSNILKIIYSYFILPLIFLSFIFTNYIPIFLAILICIISTFIFLLDTKFRNIFFTIAIVAFLYLFFFLSSFNRDLFYLIIFLSFINDTCAYIFGNLFKGPLIVPKISPKKTWSGTLLSFLISFFILIYFNFNFFISIIISISLFLGDTLFSYFKRKLNIKDFSSIFFSHGGILDRLDSMFLVFIILNIYNTITFI